MDPERPLRFFQRYTGHIPRLSQQIDALRADSGRALPPWPSWCYLPYAGFLTILAEGDESRVEEVSLSARFVAGLATWSATRGIYQFDPTVFDEVWNTPTTGELPVEVLQRLPEWCCYVPIDPPRSGPTFGGEYSLLRGFFVYLEWSLYTKAAELHFLLDLENVDDAVDEEPRLFPIELRLSEPTIEASLRIPLGDAGQRDSLVRWAQNLDSDSQFIEVLAPLVSLTLYLCSSTADYADAAGSNRQPTRPRPQKTKKGERLFAPSQSTTWEVSYRLGAALRRAQTEAGDETEIEDETETEIDLEEAESTQRQRPRAHVRRAHWHHYWVGPRAGERKLIVKWMPPIAVGLPEDLVTTIRPVL